MGLLAAACGAEERAPSGSDARAPSHAGPAPAVELSSAPDDPVLAYSWDGRPPVPAPLPGEDAADPWTVRAPWGEAGVGPDTRFYLPAHTAGELALDRSSHRVPVRAHGARFAPGRFGGGVALPADGSFEIGGDEPLFAEPFAIELWLRADEEPRDRRHVLSVPNVLAVLRKEDGKLVLRLDSEPRVWVATEHALRDGWNHLAVVYGGLPMHPFRLVLNGEAVQGLLESQAPPAPAARLSVGGTGGPHEGLPMTVDDVRVRSRAPATGEVLDRLAPPAPGFRVLRARRPSGESEHLRWTLALERAPRSEADWSSGELRHVVVRAGGGLRRVDAHWERDEATNPPPPRTAHASAFLGDHRILVFGGEARDSHANPQINTNDTWIYRTDRKVWEEVRSDVAPSPRCHVPTAYSGERGFALLAGGLLNGRFVENRTMDDTWAFVPEPGRWVPLDPQGSLPRFSDPILVYHESAGAFVMILHSRVFVYAPEAGKWRRLPNPRAETEDGEPSDYRPGGSSMGVYEPESGRVFLFGGALKTEDGQLYHGRTAWYDLERNRFVVEHHDVAPSPRVRSGIALDPHRRRIVLFGGVRGQFSEREGDLWAYDLDERRWLEVEDSNPPGPRGGFYGMSYDPELDRFFLLCGRAAPQHFLNEVWRLAFDDEAWGVARYAFERSALEGSSRWFADWRGEEPEVRFRASADGRSWTEWEEMPGEALALAGLGDAGLLVVELRLPPAGDGESCEVLGMGFVRDGVEVPVAEGGERTLFDLGVE